MNKSIAQRPPRRYGPPLSHLVLLRIWKAEGNESQGPDDLHGKLQDPVSGHVRYFDGGSELVRILRRMLSQREADGPAQAAENGPSDGAAPSAGT